RRSSASGLHPLFGLRRSRASDFHFLLGLHRSKASGFHFSFLCSRAALRVAGQYVIIMRPVGLQHDDGIIARNGAHGAAIHDSTDGITGIVIVNHQIRTSITALEPSLDFCCVLLERNAYGMFGGLSIGISGSGADIFLSPKSFTQLVVSSSDVPLED